MIRGYRETLRGVETPVGGYSAIVYKEGDSVIAERPDGSVIIEGTAGTDDASVIQSALDSLTAGRTWKEKVAFVGEFNVPNATWIEVPSYIILEGGKFTGSGGFKISSSRVEVKDIEAVFDDSLVASFYVYVPSGGSLSDIRFHNVRAVDCGRFGFLIDSTPTNPGSIENVEFISCKAINCGRYSQYHDNVTGFDLAENIASIENLTLIGCEASGCWESGFHMENDPPKYKVVFAGCRAYANGQKPSPTYGYGFLVSGELTMVGCEAFENAGYGVRIVNRNVDYPVNIDVTTKDNDNHGVCLSEVKHLTARISSHGDLDALYLEKNVDTAYIELLAKNSNRYAIETYTTVTDWTEKFSNIVLKADIVNPAGTGGQLATLIQMVENFDFDISYYNTQSDLEYGVFLRNMRNGIVNLNINVTNGDGVTFDQSNDDVCVRGIVEAGDKAVHIHAAQDLRLDHLMLIGATDAIYASNAAQVSNVTVDLRTITFESVTNKFNGDAVGNLTIKDKNFGTTTIQNGNTSVTVAHGLATTPTKIQLTGTHSEVKDAYVSAVDNTNITITVDSAVTADRDIYWEAEV